MRRSSFYLAAKENGILCLFFLLLLSGWNQSFAQRSNSVYLEAEGVGGHYSINYERLFVENEKVRFYGSVGFSHNLLNQEGFSPRIPVQLKVGFPASATTELEIGAGFTPTWFNYTRLGYDAWLGAYSTKVSEFSIVLTGRVGLRHHLGDKAFIGCYYTPVIENQYAGQGVTHWGAVTLGFRF